MRPLRSKTKVLADEYITESPLNVSFFPSREGGSVDQENKENYLNLKEISLN